jgi:uncharacterized membrane protein
MIAHLTPVGAIHAVLTLLCIAVGAVQLLRPKRGAAHRARGYFFVYAMLVADGTALLLYRFTGTFNMFHVGAMINLACIVAAILPMLQTPRPANWKLRHYYFISWSYVGLMSAGLTELAVRTMALASRAQAWSVSAVMTVLVTAIGYILIERYRPPADPAMDVIGTIVSREGTAS